MPFKWKRHSFLNEFNYGQKRNLVRPCHNPKGNNRYHASAWGFLACCYIYCISTSMAYQSTSQCATHLLMPNWRSKRKHASIMFDIFYMLPNKMSRTQYFEYYIFICICHIHLYYYYIYLNISFQNVWCGQRSRYSLMIQLNV